MRKTLGALLFGLMACTAFANPSGGTITNGGGSISTSGSTETITQTTEKMIVNWSSYNINFGETTKYLQPDTAAIALNRVTAGNPSTIAGLLQANGNVYLINPGGILFTSSAQVNAAGFIASTLDISDSNFLNQTSYTFNQTSSPQSYVVNQGSIVANLPGGYVSLVSPLVDNEGIIVATQGKIGLGGGTSVTVNPSGLTNFIQAAAPSGTPGDVTMDNAAMTTLIQNVVNNGSIVNAGSVTVNGSTTVLGKSSGLVINGGVMHADASGAGNNPLGIVGFGSQAAVMAPGSVQTSTNPSASGGLVSFQSYGNVDSAPSSTMSAGTAQLIAGGNLWLSGTTNIGAGTLSIQSPTLSIISGSPNSSGFGTGATANTLSTGALPTNANLIFNTTGDINFNTTLNDGTGSVSLTSSQGSINNTLGAIVANQATLQAASSINADTQVSSLTVVNTGGGPTTVINNGTLSAISATTNNGNISITGTGQSLSFTGSSAVLTGTTPNLTFNNTGGNIVLNGLNAGGNPVSITASGTLTGTGSSTNLTSGTTTLTAKSIGTSASPLSTSFRGALTATASNGSVNLANSGGSLTLADISTNGAGNNVVMTNSGGDILVGVITSAGGINLLNTGGSILSNGSSTHLIGSSNSILIASGTVGTALNPLGVAISNGTLGVAAGHALNGVSVDINGVIAPISTLQSVTGSGVPTTTGQIILNGVCLNCSSDGSVSNVSLTGNAIAVNFGLLNPVAQGLYKYNPFPSNIPDLWYQTLWVNQVQNVYTPSGEIQFTYP